MQEIKDGGVCAASGFRAAAAAADIKGKNSGKLDFALLVSDEACETAALFTTNRVKAAPIQYSANLIKGGAKFFGVAANSGNANACSGKAGLSVCAEIVSAAEKAAGLNAGSLLAASTGVIGVPLPSEKMLKKIPLLVGNLDDENGRAFAEAIMTTDTVSKEFAVLCNTESGVYVIGGAAKGVGMLEPALATMLVFITTDADLPQSRLQTALEKAAALSFNAITVDGDMSTNDTVYLFANAMSGIKPDLFQFEEALIYVCKKLALMLVKDGEGAKKLVTVKVCGAKDDRQAKLCAKKIANSPLVKTMFAGEDPNWGRLVAAAGASGAEFEPDNISVRFDGLLYVANGELVDPSLERKAISVMKKPEYLIEIDLKAGSSEFTCYSCDLTKEYIAINADYRS
ncbi:MAG: bifunctional glutamate N-acetyltransferase/amino-acid acetyltransferase ArgJ [Deferribacteraceae bacterium]|jgi:glutamate N-acetyltransferase/amino-acid N-acetyltransferase|nr:bifunctional glutamate N-acetyltransferase/amino-acid acetyltransferase ArgJ [Deferribacteraceae bacterium]